MKQNSSNTLSIDHLQKLKHQTPFFVFDLKRIQKNFQEISKAVPGLEIHYAIKCNPEVKVLKKLKQLGSKFEAASFNECKLVYDLGEKPQDIFFSNPIKSPQQIKDAYKLGVRTFAFDSFSELNKISENAPGSNVYLRVIVSDTGAKWPFSSKYGASTSEAIELMRYAIVLGLTPFGLTFHVGSQSTFTNSWESAIQTSGLIMKELKSEGIILKMLDIGGGFPAHYTEEVPDLDEIGLVIQNALKKYIPYKVKIVAEPGRGMVAEAAVLVTSVNSRNLRANKHWLYIDVGVFNGLIETTSFQGSLVYPIETSKDITDHKKIPYTVTGPTCESLDTMFENIQLPDNLQLGDKLFIKSAGAYTLSCASNYNGFGPPKVYYINE